jgi:predicted outer membrane repeat protein
MFAFLFTSALPLGPVVSLPGLRHPRSSFSFLGSFSVHLRSLHIASWTFEHKSSGSGGAVSFSDAYLEITDCLFQSNSATLEGGAVRLASRVSAMAISDSFFLRNSAKDGGAVYCQCLYGWATIEGTLFDNNTAASGQHITVDGCGTLSLSSCSLRNSVGWEPMRIRRSPYIYLESCTFFRNSGAVTVGLNEKDTLDVADCCFADGSVYLDLSSSWNVTVTLTDCCFNGTNESSIRLANVKVAFLDCTFGECDECTFPKTPPPSQTMHATMSSPAVIVMIMVICGVAAIAVVGTLILRWRCERGQRFHPEDEGGRRSALSRRLIGTGEDELLAPG